MNILNHWYDEVLARTKDDPWHKECLAEVARWESRFLEIRESLSPADREALDYYIAACEQLRSSFIYPAYEAGCWHGKTSEIRD